MKDHTINNPSYVSAIEEATHRQRSASNPVVSSWVGASAGSGKTKVLTDRILRLLLPRENGEPATRPEKILALTFTKAAANEMALRLSSRLSTWSVESEENLFKDMKDNLLGRPPTKEEMIGARKLFAKVIDAPGGINIMTIHSFCQSVLGRFPIEANIPPNFKPLEEEQASALLKESIDGILSDALRDKQNPLSQAISNIARMISEDQFRTLIKSALSERHQFKVILGRTFGVDGLYTNLCQHLGIQAGTTAVQEKSYFCDTANLDEAGLRLCCAVMAESKNKTDVERADIIQDFLDSSPADRVRLYDSYKAAYLKQDGDILKTLVTKDTMKTNPDILKILSHEAKRLYALEEKLKSIGCAHATRDLFLILQAVIDAYTNLKNKNGALDFDDLILKTLSLLQGDISPIRSIENVTPWVMFKLDGGLDHILVDEAQDTNPEQWEIIRLLSNEFFTGMGAKEATRTLFVVGDEKQSIFGFQRAAPEKFGDMKKFFETKIRQSNQMFDPVDINTSFRSSQAILDAVDATFIQSYSQNITNSEYRRHRAKREGQAGVVELWPILKSDIPEEDEEAENDWEIPTIPIELRSGSIKIAKKIGDRIESWLKNPQTEILESHARPIRAGDILVLVRSRNAFVAQLVRELKTRGIPVSGVDRMVLSDQLVAQDLCSTASFALLPDDDLTLACLLKSPFIGLSEDELYDLAYGRERTSLWNKIKDSKRHVVIKDWLEKQIFRVGYLKPYEFFSSLIQEDCPTSPISGMQAIRARLGEDSMDPLDEFLNSAIIFEQNHSGGMQDFIKWHRSSASEIKREMDEGGNAVRIMTIHGAKGLQAPIVFLPDTIKQKSGGSGIQLFWHHKTGLEVPFFCPISSMMPDTLKSAKRTIEEKDEEESRRLLYVAMTRAEERLYIGGHLGKKAPPKERPYWYKDILTGLTSEPKTEIIKLSENPDDQILKLQLKRTAEPDKAGAVKNRAGTQGVVIESWVRQKAPSEPVPPTPLIPSRPSEEEPASVHPLSQGVEDRFKRGNITHKLLQTLPDIDSTKREYVLRTYLSNPAHKLDHHTQTSIFQEITTILNDPVFGSIFGEGSRAEVPITGLIGAGDLISGQIDRILVTDKEVLIIDFKTNRPPPENVRDVPSIYKRQMSIYKDALSVIYPDRKIRTALLWTDGARLMEI